MKKLRQISRKYYLRQIVSCWLVYYMLFLFGMPANVALATPICTDNGGATVDTSVPNLTDVLVNQQETLMQWSSFDTSSAETVKFRDGELSGTKVLSDITGGKTQFDGHLIGDEGMALYFRNHAGFVFGAGSTVNVTQLLVTSLNIDDDALLNGGPYTFTDGLSAGDIENYGEINAKEVVALIGKKIINDGIIAVDDGGYAILAAGDQVVITESGSNIAVEVDMGGQEPADFTVENYGGIGVEGETARVVLAAGDIWSSAYVSAYSEGGSDAVASVDIDAKGDVDIEDDVLAQATVVDNDGDDDAIATVTIDAGGDVTVTSNTAFDDTEIKATANDGLNNTAKVEITAEGEFKQNDAVVIQAVADPVEEVASVLNQADVSITGRNVTLETLSEGWIDWWFSADALIGAYASDAQENRASVNITATGGEVDEIYVPGNVLLQTRGIKDCALVEASAEDGATNSADVVINATGNVGVMACSADSKVIAEASNELDEGDLSDGAIAGLTNTANVDITAGGSVEIKGAFLNDALVEAVAKNVIEIPEPEIIDDVPQEVVVDLSAEGLTNTANINITANNGNVDVKAECANSGAEAVVKATADNEIKVDIDNFVEDEAPAVTVNLDLADLENNAGVTIIANGEESGVTVEGAHGDGLVRSEAYNMLDVEHKGCWEKVRVEGRWTWVYNPVADAALNLTVDGLTNTATVDITATNGSVDVMADGGYYCWWEWNPYTAGVEAETYNDFAMDFDNETPTSSLAFNNLTNTAGIGITAGEDVEVLAENGGEAGINASAWNYVNAADEENDDITGNNITNNAGVDIVAGGDVKVKADCLGDCSDASISAEASNDGDADIEGDIEEVALQNITNTASVDITAGGDVKVIGKDCGSAEIAADTQLGTENTSSITINTLDGDVLVLGKNGDASIEATAEEGVDNTATVGIDAVGGDVKVIDIGDGKSDARTAKIVASAEDAYNSNTADVTINATAATCDYTYEDEKVYTEVYGGDILVLGKDGGHAAITAFADGAYSMSRDDSETYETSNTANVTINAIAAEGTRPKEAEIPVPETIEAIYVTEPIYVPIYEAEAYTDGGDVKVIGECGGEAEIEAIAKDSYGDNAADVLICADGDVKVKGDRGGEAEIEALAIDGYTTNEASVAICAWGDEGVEVAADRGGEAGISSKAKYGYLNTNTASTLIYAHQGDVQVTADRGGDARIKSETEYGVENDSYVWINADGDVLVRAGQMEQPGCKAEIEAVAEAGGEYKPETSTDAQVHVIANNGGIGVVGFNGGDAKIQAKASGGDTSNNAYAGVSAGGDLDISFLPWWMQEYFFGEEGTVGFVPNVLVKGFGEGSKAWIWSFANGYEYDATNTAKTVVCTPGELFVGGAEGGYAAVKSWAFGWGEGADNSATTKIYAGNGTARGLGEIGDDDVSADIVFAGDAEIYAKTKGLAGEHKLCLQPDGTVYEYIEGEGSGASLIISDYASRTDCPTCPPCPCEEEGLSAPVAPLAQYSIPRIEGCPALMLAAALELGLTPETFQVGMGNALALNPSLQPCGACAALINAAKILRDKDGSRMAAMVQTFNTLAPANTPMSPEMENSIAMAFADAAEGSQYALAKEYIDAFVQYASVLDNQLGSPVGDSVVFVMGKYGAGVTGSDNSNIAAFVMSRLTSE